MDFVFNTSPNICCRQGASDGLGPLATKLLGSEILFVTDKGLVDLGLTDKPIKSLRESGCTVTIFDGTEPDPSLKILEQAIAKALDIKATGIIGFGGGSSMDLAKLAALVAGSGENLDEAWGVGLAKGPRLPLVLVPTTAGTGSEVTPVSIITVGGDEKRGVSSPVILPDLAILDASLTTGLPQHITAATGIDAMVHAIEAYTSRAKNSNPMSKMLAVEALKLLGANIKTACFDGNNIEAREAMLLGSMLAGMAFANSPVAAVHALAYPIGGMFHIPHGLSNALVLKEVMRFNSPVCSSEYAELAPHIFPDLANETSSQAICSALIERLGQLSKEIGLQQGLREVGITRDDLPIMAKAAMKQTRLLVNNPREVSESDALSIYKAAW
ncbi:MAG: iron-containing alcohol dehydrogenase [Salaquimonas sp.]